MNRDQSNNKKLRRIELDHIQISINTSVTNFRLKKISMVSLSLFKYWVFI